MIKGSEERLLLQIRSNMNEAPLISAIVPSIQRSRTWTVAWKVLWTRPTRS